jgi:hypothetical protein
MALQALKSPLVLSGKVRLFLTLLKIGFGNAVGLAIAQAHTAAVYNKPGFDIVGTTFVNGVNER